MFFYNLVKYKKMSLKFNVLNQPYKIIYKVNNKNNKYQYYTYIFVGDVNKSIEDIIIKFQNLSLFDTLNKLNKQEYTLLSDFYNTDLWFKYFFNKYHINDFLKKKDIKKFEDKFSVNFPKSNLSLNHKFTYGYLLHRKQIIHDKILNKDYVDNFNNISVNSLFNELDKEDKEDVLVGGNDIIDNNTDEIEESFDSFINDNQDTNISDDFVELNTDEQNISNQQLDNINEDDNIEYDNDYMKQEIKDENKIINKVNNVLDNKSLLKFINFDKSKDDVLYNEELKNHYSKQYVFTTFIKLSDTIQDIKNKIFFTIKNNPKYGKENLLEPSRIYLWSEYMYKDNYELYQLGKEILENNKLLKFPIEPVNLDNYINPDYSKNNYDFIKKISKFYNIRVNDKLQTLLFEHKQYIDNNEIFMIDIYNEIGFINSMVINESQKENLYKYFCFLYFNQIKFDDIDNILNYIIYSNKDNATNIDTNKRNKEIDFINLCFNLQYSDYLLKTWLDNTLTNTYKHNEKEIKEMIPNYCITRIQLNVDLHNNNEEINNIDTHTIFNELEANNKFLFIQYTKLNGTTLYKFNEIELKKYINLIFSGAIQSNLDQVIKWFNISQPGLIFKYQYQENKRPMHIYIDNFGRLNFDIYTNCENKFHYEELDNYKKIIREIIIEINKTGINYPFILPEDKDYNIKFINCIKDIKFTDKINYNNLSDLYSIYFPYFSNIIEPKRKKDEEQYYGKSGIYLRYKKISNYNSKDKIRKTIRKYRKYYNNSESEIVVQISKEFNLSIEDSQKFFDENLKLFPRIRQVKDTKTITNKTKVKHEGISIELQHKENSYVLKYHGLRNQEQDNEITQYMLIILYIYKQIYINKNKDFYYIKDKIKDITNIAKRKLEILNFVEHTEKLTGVKELQDKDKNRLKFKANQNKSVWSRLCQNSGKLKRQPKVFTNIESLLKYGYKLNKATGYYERQIKDKKGNNITLKAVNFSNIDSSDSSSSVYYTCNPETNGNQIYIGLLNKINPDGKALPCCFINDKLEKQITNYKKKIQNIKESKDIYNLNYILINNRYVPLNRLKFLPNIIDYYLNKLQNKNYTENNHILKSTKPDYYFIVGTNEDQKVNNFLFTIAHSLNITVSDIFNKITKSLTDEIFNSLNNGMIKLMYKTKDNYINKIKEYSNYENNLKTDDIKHLLTIPSVLSDNGLNIIIIEKGKVSNTTYKKNTTRDFYINYVNTEEVDLIDDPKRLNIILFYNGFEYSIISRVNKLESDIEPYYTKSFKGDDELILYIKDYYKSYNNMLDNVYKDLVAKKMYKLLNFQLSKDKNIKIIKQYINTLNKTVFIEIENNKEHILIPTIPSGSIYNLNIDSVNNIKPNKFNVFKSNEKFYNNLNLKHIGYYFYKIKDDQYYVKEIMLFNGEYKIPLPIEKLKIKIKDKDTNKLYFYKQYYKNIDSVIKKYPNVEYIPDDRVSYIEYNKYKDIVYQYFRYGISKYLSKNKKLKEELIKIVNSKPDTIKDIRYIIYSLIDNQQLHKFYKEMERKDIKENKLDQFTIRIFNKSDIEHKIRNHDFNKDNLIKFDISKCQDNIIFSLDKNKKCVFSITFDLLVDFINNVCYELLNNGIKSNEILNIDGYFVSPIINTNIYKLKEGQKLLRKNTEEKKNVFIYYLKDNPDKIRDFDPSDDDKYQDYYKLSYKYKKQEDKMNEQIELNKGKIIKSFIYQPVFITDSYLRAYVNCIFWLMNKKVDNNTPDSIKNLGYYSSDQDRIISYIKSQLIDYILFNKFNEIEKKKIKDDKLINKLSKNTNDLKYKEILKINFMLLNIFKFNIILIDQYNNIQNVFSNNNSKNTTVFKDKNIESVKDQLIDTVLIRINNYENKKIDSVYLIIN